MQKCARTSFTAPDSSQDRQTDRQLQLRLARDLCLPLFEYIAIGNRTPALTRRLRQREWRLLEVGSEEDRMADGAVVQRCEKGCWRLCRAEWWHGFDLRPRSSYTCAVLEVLVMGRSRCFLQGAARLMRVVGEGGLLGRLDGVSVETK